MKKRNKILLVVILQLLTCFTYGQFKSVFNKAITAVDSTGNFSFIVSGHFHGSSSNQSTYPAATLLASIDTLNDLNPVFLISLGDLFIDVNDTYVEHYQKSLFDKLKMPLYNAVGNHDISNGNIYEKFYGKTYYKLSINENLFIVLNTEIDDGSIKGDQLDFLKNLLEQTLKSDTQFKNFFIFSHRPVWSENNDRYKQLFSDNTRTTLGKNNFESDIKPLLTELAKTKTIFWMSGSLGSGPASFFYDKDPESKIHFMQTAIRDLPRDAVLQVNVKNGVVSFNGISLTGQKLNSIESYNIDYWSHTVADEGKFNFRMLPYLTMQMLKHYYFWIGFVLSLLSIFVFRFLYVKWKRRR